MTDLNKYLEALMADDESKTKEAARVEHTSFAELASRAGIKLAMSKCPKCGTDMKKMGAMYKCSCGSSKSAEPQDIEYRPPNEEAGGQGKEAAVVVKTASKRGISPRQYLEKKAAEKTAILDVALGGMAGYREGKKRGRPGAGAAVGAAGGVGGAILGGVGGGAAGALGGAGIGALASLISRGKVDPNTVKLLAGGVGRVGAGTGALVGAHKGGGWAARQLTPEKKPPTPAAQDDKTASIADEAGRMLAKNAAPLSITGSELREAVQEARAREDIAGRSKRWGQAGAGAGALAAGGALGTAGYQAGKALGGTKAPWARLLGAGLGAVGGGIGGAGVGGTIGRQEGAEEAAADQLVSRIRAGQASRRGALMGYMAGRGRFAPQQRPPVESTHTSNFRGMTNSMKPQEKTGAAFPFLKGR